ncbi:hypothetical protein XF36_21955 [Pseudonocardia sp. HH130629-09]|nr:hypothetical protein XF36_21955 [Pseudonocardia sp. HH130629-09]
MAPGWTATVARLVHAAPAGPAGNRLVTVDGFSGAGKSTRARELADRLGAPLIEIEDLCPGWDGLSRVPALARRGIGDPLVAGTTLRWTSWDWAHDRPGPERTLAPAAVVVLEGCGSGAAALAPVTSLAIWVEASAEERERRLWERPDWPGYAPFRDGWRRAEQALARSGGAPERADLVLYGGARRHPP